MRPDFVSQDVPRNGVLLPVPDVLQALELLSRAARARSTAHITAITGSVGKTGVNSALAAALGKTGVVHASMGSHELAVDIFRYLYDRFPEHPECLNNLAVCLVRIDRSLDEVASLIQLAREKNPDYLDARHNQSILKTDSFDVGQLILTVKPLRPNLTHLDKYN